jgi:Na+/proline symporter
MKRLLSPSLLLISLITHPVTNEVINKLNISPTELIDISKVECAILIFAVSLYGYIEINVIYIILKIIIKLRDILSTDVNFPTFCNG